jgi:ubiquinone/menaquinone biosynthesis C-methylase UbiE
MHAETLSAAEWWQRSRGETNKSWIENYQRSLKNRHRDVIVSIVKSMPGTASILEVGCHCGPNLVRLASDIPSLTHLTGFDVNADAITAGQDWLRQLDLEKRITLVQGRMPEATTDLADGCVDVVLACYALAYIAPPDLDGVLWEMGRLAKRAVIVAEPMTAHPTSQIKTNWGYREWAHNYLGASKWIGTWRGSALSVRQVVPPVDALSEILVVEKSSMPLGAATP